MQRHLSLVRCHLFMFAFAYFALGYRAKKKKKKFPKIYVINCYTCVLLGGFFFFFSGLILRSLIHFEFVFGIRCEEIF